MFTKSIRWRLHLWLAFLLVCVLSGFGVTVYQLQRITQLHQLDEELELRVAALNLLLEKAGANNPRKPLYHRTVTALAESHPPELLAEIAKASDALEAMLDADFRVPRTTQLA